MKRSAGILLVLLFALFSAWPARAGSLSITSTGPDGEKSTTTRTYSEDYYQKARPRVRLHRRPAAPQPSGPRTRSGTPAGTLGEREAEQRFEEIINRWEDVNDQMDDVYDEFKQDAERMN
jgi:hypothetical protein